MKSPVSKLLDSSLASRNAAGEFAIAGALEQMHPQILMSIADSLLASALMQDEASRRARRLEKRMGPLVDRAADYAANVLSAPPSDEPLVPTGIPFGMYPDPDLVELLAAGSDAIAVLEPGSIARKRLEASHETWRQILTPDPPTENPS